MSAITVNGDLVHYEKLGRGRPVILIHGWVGSWRYWIPLMQQLHLRYKVYTLDLPGFGDSSKNPAHYTIEYQVTLLDRFMEQLGIVKAAFIGHGLGALVMTEFAYQNQDKVARLLLIGAPLFDPGDLDERTPAGQRVLLTAPNASDPTIASGATPGNPEETAVPAPASTTEETLIRRPAGLDNVVSMSDDAPVITTPEPHASQPTIANPSSIDRDRLLERAREIQAQRQTSGNNPLAERFSGKSMMDLLDKAFKRSEDVYTKLKPDVEKADDKVLGISSTKYDSGTMLDHLRMIDIPILVVHGEGDTIIPVPKEGVWNYLTVDKDDTLVPILLPDVRHFPMLEHESFPRLTTDFLEAEDISKLELRERWRRRSR